ncbi:MAG: hypothetical protein ISEC1_P1875 [Thiomicrorhabdus sp.]|nr:MAG: hypothetical protein ISEC1_P1875 [Thiomicrorhabdus sp.]
MHLNALQVLLLSLTLSACQTTAIKPIETKSNPLLHAYDFHIINTQSQQQITIDQLAEQLSSYDVVFIGEFHGNHASHLLETLLLAKLYQLRPEQQLSLEMFNRDQQTALNRYLDGEIGEVALVRKTPTWNNYIAGYRPVVEFAKQNFIPVIAANASADIVRCIGREGKAYLDKLSEDEQQYIAQAPFIDNTLYREKYLSVMEDSKHLTDESKERSYLAQLTRDNTMAESISHAYEEAPETQIIHLNGSFHSEASLGTVSALKTRQPKLKVAVITPIAVEDPSQPSYLDKDLQSGDFIYLIQSQPEQYQDAAYRQEIMQAMFKRASTATCKP